MNGRPPAPEVLREVRAAVAGGRYLQAQELARRQLDAGFEHPQLLQLRSIWLEQHGRLVEALADLERARALDPSELGVVMALGSLLERLNERVRAREAFQLAVELRPTLPGPWVRLGWASENLGFIDGARSAYGQAVDLDPTNAQALGRLALISAQQGDWQDARAWAERALRANPEEFTADLAHLRADIREGRLDEAEQRLTRILGKRLPPDDLYLAHKELGALRDLQGRYADAFDAWATGNAIAHRHHARTFGAPRGSAALTRQLEEYFAAERPWPQATAAPSTASEHVFLLGFARSGTTLLEQVLAAHPDVLALEEKETLRSAIEAFGGWPDGLDRLREASEETLAPVREAYWRDVASYGAHPAGKVFIDKSPFNALRLPYIARMFPQAKVLFALRDPRDVILSCFRTPFRVNGVVYELLRIEDAGRYYASYMAAAEHIRRTIPMNVLPVRHEDLLDDFEGEVRRVCDFIGIDLRAEMLSFETSGRKVATPSAHQLREGLTRNRSGQWTRYAEQLEPALPHLAPWVERFGYGAGE